VADRGAQERALKIKSCELEVFHAASREAGAGGENRDEELAL
jgi:hypothetical protein